MQSISPLSITDLLEQGTQPLLKIEILSGNFSPFGEWDKYGSQLYGAGKYGGGWLNPNEFTGVDGDCIMSVSMSLAGAVLSPDPVAAKWSLRLANPEAIFHPAHPTSSYVEVFKLGRKVKIYIGIQINGVDYYWLQILGIMEKPSFDGPKHDIMIEGTDYMGILKSTKLRSPDNYWGSTVTKSTVAGQYRYNMPADCTGVYYVVWNGAPIYEGNDWTYEEYSANDFVLNADKTIENGSSNLVIYYFTRQLAEEVLADILVTAGLYEDQAAALAAMDYTPTPSGRGFIDKVWFDAGTSCLNAIRKICQLLNYRYYHEYDGTPSFKPAPSAKADGSEDLELNIHQYTNYKYYENKEEVFNRVAITGIAQASPEWREDAAENRLRGVASDSDSIEEIGERTLSIENHLFQDQVTIDAMCNTLLANYKTPKHYFNFDLRFSPIPLEYGDTVKLKRRLTTPSGKPYDTFLYDDGTLYGDNGTIIEQRGLIRDIKINNHGMTFQCEEVA